MIVGIGTDLLHIPRIKALIAKRGAPTLARRILSPRELTEFKALIRGKLDLGASSSSSASTSKAGSGSCAGSGSGVKGTADGDNAERTSFRTVLKGLNRNIENEEVTRFLASRSVFSVLFLCFDASSLFQFLERVGLRPSLSF